jgi:hypothetical protein
MLDVEALSEMMAGIIAEEVGKAVGPLQARIADLEARPAPEKGDPGERGADGVNGADGAPGADGRGIKSLLIDREGALVATMDDGEMKTLGPVIGKDGQNGADGKDGRDGISLDSFEAIVLDDDRTIELKFVSGETERVASFKWPQPLDCGVYKAGEQYDRGDIVTWGGSMWLAQRATAEKPDTPDSGWRLAVKKGRDGKDAKNG